MLPLLALLACPRSTPPTPAAETPTVAVETLAPGLSAAPAAGAPPMPALVPPADAPSIPSLSGSVNAVELVGSNKSRLVFTLGGDLTALNSIDESELATLTEHLAANPRWRLTRWEGALIAMLRVDDSALGRTVPWAGYHQAADAQWRASLRLSARDESSAWRSSSLVNRFSPEDNSLKINGWQPDGEGMYAWRSAALEANGPVVALELHELSPTLELSHTAEALRQAMRSLLNFDQFKEDGDAQSAPWGWLPPGEPSPDPAGIWVTSTPQGLDLRGRLNPGAPGWTWARITDAQGRSWLEELVAAATLERIGWSDQSSQTFWFQGRVPTDLPLPPGAVVEAWFLADRGGEPVRIGRWSVGP